VLAPPERNADRINVDIKRLWPGKGRGWNVVDGNAIINGVEALKQEQRCRQCDLTKPGRINICDEFDHSRDLECESDPR
jgi:hypothetical protein